MSAPIVEILTIGREILDGRVVDTNSVWLAENLKELGLIPRYAQRVDDEIERVVEAYGIAAKRSQIILVTGGLGPTADDLTAEAFAKYLGEKLELNVEALKQVEEIFAKLGRKLIDQQKKQAIFPPSCEILENTQGTAPGFARHFDSGQSWYFMPGVPKEMKAMFTKSIFPRLPKIAGYRSNHWATQFTSEGELQAKLIGVHEALLSSFEITYRTRYPENHIGLHGICDSEEKSRAYEKLSARISEILGTTFFSSGKELEDLEHVVLKLLIDQKRNFGSVESCTGGLVADRITNIAGSSAAFWSSWVCYENRAKEALGIDTEVIREKGAVSEEIARSLAEAGVKHLTEMGAPNAICVATTGIAGPGGGSETKPVGLCYVAVAGKGIDTQIEEVRARPYLQRAEYKRLFSQKALELVRQVLLRSR